MIYRLAPVALLFSCAGPATDAVVLQDPHVAFQVQVLLDAEIRASDGFAGAWFAHQVSGAGDVNGDGYADIIVSAQGDDALGVQAGAAYVYLGSANGIDTGTELKITASDGGPEQFFGVVVSGAGDVNNDGYDDVIIGAQKDDATDVDAGAAYIYLGSSGGIDVGSELKILATDGAAADLFGCAVSATGDVNGDGFDDVIVGAFQDGDVEPLSGSAYVYLGSASGIDPNTEAKISASTPQALGMFGYSVAGAGDVDGDGYDDIIVGSFGDLGSVYLYHGSSSGPDLTTESRISSSDRSYNDFFGYTLSSAGDVNADGYDDIIVGAFSSYQVASASGSAYIFFGTATGVDAASEIKLVPSDGAQDDFFGGSVAGSDLDGDGFSDVIIGAMGDDTASSPDAGSAYIYLGSATGIDVMSETKVSDVNANNDDIYGFSVAGAGDVNGDGFNDVVIGAFGTDAYTGTAYTYRGGCIAPAAWYVDADGDGFGDPATVVESCDVLTGHADNGDDCDDTDPDVYPGAVEIEDDGIDQDCDGEDLPSVEDTDPTDNDPVPDTGISSGATKTGGCGCASGSIPAGMWLVWLPVLLFRRGPHHGAHSSM